MQQRKFENSNCEVSAIGLDRIATSFPYGAPVLPVREQLGICFVPYSPLAAQSASVCSPRASLAMMLAGASSSGAI